MHRATAGIATPFEPDAFSDSGIDEHGCRSTDAAE